PQGYAPARQKRARKDKPCSSPKIVKSASAPCPQGFPFPTAFGRQGASRAKPLGSLCNAACVFLKFPTLSTWFSTQKALFLHEKGFVCGKLPRCILLHINFSTYGSTVDFQAPFKEKLWKT
uniref:hypothetical protein n=1 Tax=Gemmiger formicilis TaxID=745368 RepID=UPI0040259B85